VDALVSTGEEGRVNLRKVSVSRKKALTRKYPNGETHWTKHPVSKTEYIGFGSETR
jgi:hypothetical protein